MAETKYLVIQEKICARCGGACFVQHPAWAAFWKAHGSFGADIEVAKRWFKKKGFDLNTFKIDGLPDETVICPECQGKGTIISQIELREAMQDLGFISSELVNSGLVESK